MEFIALIISVLALFLSLLQFLFESLRQKRAATLAAYGELEEKVFSNLDNRKEEFFQAEYLSEEWMEITKYLSEIEAFSVGVNTGVYSFRTLNRLGGGYFIRQFQRLKPIIDIKRDKNISFGKHYDEFEKVALKLKKYRKKFGEEK